MHSPSSHDTRLERILGVPLADGAVRQWPQSGEGDRRPAVFPSDPERAAYSNVEVAID